MGKDAENTTPAPPAAPEVPEPPAPPPPPAPVDPEPAKVTLQKIDPPPPPLEDAPLKDVDGVDWERKFHGSQGVAKQFRDQVVTQQEQLTASNEQLAALASTPSDLKEARAEIVQLREINERNVRHGELRGVVAKDFPDLLPLLDDGLMLGVDTLEGDALTDHLTRLRTQFGGGNQGELDETLSGATPASPAGGSTGVTESVEDLFQKLMNLNPGSDEYVKTNRAYLMAQEKVLAKAEK